jgi:hypothetical protein
VLLLVSLFADALIHPFTFSARRSTMNGPSHPVFALIRFAATVARPGDADKIEQRMTVLIDCLNEAAIEDPSDGKRRSVWSEAARRIGISEPALYEWFERLVKRSERQLRRWGLWEMSGATLD